jgi:hypothetical protein
VEKCTKCKTESGTNLTFFFTVLMQDSENVNAFFGFMEHLPKIEFKTADDVEQKLLEMQDMPATVDYFCKEGKNKILELAFD